jgi:hypothetical protein
VTRRHPRISAHLLVPVVLACLGWLVAGGAGSALAGTGLTGSALAGSARAGSALTGTAEDPTWRWPLHPAPTVVRPFDPPERDWLPGHRGVDLAAVPGQPVVAVAPGTVTFAGRLAGRGVVVVDHGSIRSTYEPVRAAVHRGQSVQADQRLGTVTTVRSHCLPAACLHLGAKRGDAYLDPLSLLADRTIRLKPLAGVGPGDDFPAPAASSQPTGQGDSPRPSGPDAGLVAPAALGATAATSLLAAGAWRRRQARG